MRDTKPDRDPAPSERSQRALDWLNFFIADVETGFGPFIVVYLAANGWLQGQIGLVLTVGSVCGIASQLPGGAIVDGVRSKRGVIAVALVMVAAGALLFYFSAAFWFVLLAQLLHGLTAGLITPAKAAIGLGLVGRRGLSRRLGRNHRYDSFGNAGTAGIMGVLGHFVAKSASFLFAAFLCLPALLGRIPHPEFGNRLRTSPQCHGRRDRRASGPLSRPAEEQATDRLRRRPGSVPGCQCLRDPPGHRALRAAWLRLLGADCRRPGDRAAGDHGHDRALDGEAGRCVGAQAAAAVSVRSTGAAGAAIHRDARTALAAPDANAERDRRGRTRHPQPPDHCRRDGRQRTIQFGAGCRRHDNGDRRRRQHDSDRLPRASPSALRPACWCLRLSRRQGSSSS